MHHLILDTCVWVTLAKFEFSLVAKLAQLIDTKKVTIVLPELIRKEWNDCKTHIVKQITDEVTDHRRSAIRLRTFLDSPALADSFDRISSVDPVSTGTQIAAHRIAAIEKILDSDSIIWVPLSSHTKSLAITHALEKKPPFRDRNSMADALIFLSAVERMKANKPNNAVFITHNTNDFSDQKRDKDDRHCKERLAPELQLLVHKSTFRYEIVLGRVLNEIEPFVATEEEIERGETIVECTRALDERIRILSGAIADILKRHEQRMAMAGRAIAGVLKGHEIQQRMAAGAIAGVLKQLVDGADTIDDHGKGGSDDAIPGEE